MRSSTGRCLLLLPILAALTLAASACGDDDSSSTTSPSTTVTSTTDTFSGSISQNGSAVHKFSVSTSGYTVLAGYTSIAPATVSALGMGIGVWDSTNSACGLNQAQNDTARSGSTAVSGTANSGSYCIRVYDGGNIPEGVTVAYTLQVEHY